MAKKNDSATTTANHRDWLTVESKCRNCGTIITEWRPKLDFNMPIESKGRRRECYLCLAKWWNNLCREAEMRIAILREREEQLVRSGRLQ